MKIVEVEWVDAYIDTNDFSAEKARKYKPVPRKTVGWLVSENDDCIVLATDIYPKEKKHKYSSPMVIPWGWIEEYWELECVSSSPPVELLPPRHSLR